MLSAKDASMIYETLLSSPGMSENVRISLQLPRRNVLLLAKLIGRGLEAKEGTENSILSMVGESTISEINDVTAELLKKAGLTDMNEKLESFANR